MRTLIEHGSVTILIGLLSKDDISYQYRIATVQDPQSLPKVQHKAITSAVQNFVRAVGFASISATIECILQVGNSVSKALPPRAFPLHSPVLIAVSTCRNEAGYQQCNFGAACKSPPYNPYRY